MKEGTVQQRFQITWRGSLFPMVLMIRVKRREILENDQTNPIVDLIPFGNHVTMDL